MEEFYPNAADDHNNVSLNMNFAMTFVELCSIDNSPPQLFCSGHG